MKIQCEIGGIAVGAAGRFVSNVLRAKVGFRQANLP